MKVTFSLIDNMELIFATANQNKVAEISKLVPEGYIIKSLKDIGFFKDIPEDYLTLEENAIHKANTIFSQIGISCFADDTGLEIESLNGEPGVHSARYAGADRNNEANISKVLDKLKIYQNRKARFRTVIALSSEKGQELFEGVVHGEILRIPQGDGGFGYDPIFKPEGYEKSFAEMTLDEKNKTSHRAKAIAKFIAFLEQS